jgi:hypothetical protein
LTRKTGKGKLNILIDMTLHGLGPGGYVLDEIAHTVNEGRFSTNKFLRYGNARRILGPEGAAGLRLMKTLSRLLLGKSAR